MTLQHPESEQDQAAPVAVQSTDSQQAEPTSAPPVPKELMSARPAMTKVVPKVQEQTAAASAATAEPAAPTPEEHAAQQERIDYLRQLRDKKPKKSHKKWPWIILIIIFLLLIGAGIAWWQQRKPASKPTAQTNQSTTNQQTSQAPASKLPTKSYSSPNFNLSFNYPATWTVSETSTAITVASPTMALTGADGQNHQGVVTMMIRNQQSSLPEFSGGSATAVLNSNKVAYINPSQTQRAQTYISYLQYAATTAHGGLDALYITGNSGYQKGQDIPQADVVKVDPLITVSFGTCPASGSCPLPKQTPLTIAASSWTGSLKANVESMLKSLTIQ